MKDQTGMQLVRQGAYTAVGALLVYGVLAVSAALLRPRPAAAASSSGGCGCGCGGK